MRRKVECVATTFECKSIGDYYENLKSRPVFILLLPRTFPEPSFYLRPTRNYVSQQFSPCRWQYPPPIIIYRLRSTSYRGETSYKPAPASPDWKPRRKTRTVSYPQNQPLFRNSKTYQLLQMRHPRNPISKERRPPSIQRWKRWHKRRLPLQHPGI